MPTAIAHAPPFTVPGSSTSTALVRWNGTGGNQIQDSTILVGATTMGLAADTDLVTFSNGTLTIAGTVAATTLTGAGAGITALAAANITASGTLPALNGAALTALNGTQVTSGTLPAARIADDSIVEAKLDVSNGPTNGQFLQAQSGEGGGLTWAAAGGGPTEAVETDMENEGSSNANRYASPEVLKHHPGVAKFWVDINASSGTPVIDGDYNVGSLDDNGTGNFDVNFSVVFDNANYAVVGSTSYSSAYTSFMCEGVQYHTSSYQRIMCIANSGGNAGIDGNGIFVAGFGEQ